MCEQTRSDGKARRFNSRQVLNLGLAVLVSIAIFVAI